MNKIDHLETGYQDLRRLINEFGIVMTRSVNNNISTNGRQSNKTTRSKFDMRQSTSSDVTGPGPHHLETQDRTVLQTPTVNGRSHQANVGEKKVRPGSRQTADANGDELAHLSSQHAQASSYNTVAKRNLLNQKAHVPSINSTLGAIQKSWLVCSSPLAYVNSDWY